MLKFEFEKSLLISTENENSFTIFTVISVPDDNVIVSQTYCHQSTAL